MTERLTVNTNHILDAQNDGKLLNTVIIENRSKNIWENKKNKNKKKKNLLKGSPNAMDVFLKERKI